MVIMSDEYLSSSKLKHDSMLGIGNSGSFV